MIRLKYQGKTVEYAGKKKTTTLVLYGTEAECVAWRGEHPEGTAAGILPDLGIEEDPGEITSITITQSDGDIYVLTAKCTVEDTDAVIVSATGESGVKHSTVTVRQLQLPLEKNKNYRYCWNHILLKRGDAGEDVSDFLTTETPWHPPSGCEDKYKVVSSVSEIPAEPDADGNVWMIAYDMLKPGVQSFGIPVYELTEQVKCASKNAIKKFLTTKIGKYSTPENGDFGLMSALTGSMWFCEGTSIQYDGKSWLASTVYTLDPTPDTAMYEVDA